MYGGVSCHHWKQKLKERNILDDFNPKQEQWALRFRKLDLDLYML